jgi:hypothetical protein
MERSAARVEALRISRMAQRPEAERAFLETAC